MAGTTRLELATSAVTGQRSNQLNYVPAAYRTEVRLVSVEMRAVLLSQERTEAKHDCKEYNVRQADAARMWSWLRRGF